MNSDSRISMTPSLGLSYRTGRANPKANIVVVEGKEKVLVCHMPTTLALRTSNGLGLPNIGLRTDPKPYEMNADAIAISPLAMKSRLEDSSPKKHREINVRIEDAENKTTEMYPQATSRTRLTIPLFIAAKSSRSPIKTSIKRQQSRMTRRGETRKISCFTPRLFNESPAYVIFMP